MARRELDPMATFTGEEMEPVSMGTVTPAAAGPEVFSGAGGYKYSYDPSTKLIKILEGPQGVGVTVRPGSTAYKSIMAEKETGKSLYQADAVEPTPAPAEEVDYGLMEGESELTEEDMLPGESLPPGFEAEEQKRAIRDRALAAAQEEHGDYGAGDRSGYDSGFMARQRIARRQQLEHAQRVREQRRREREAEAGAHERSRRSAAAAKEGARRAVEGD